MDDLTGIEPGPDRPDRPERSVGAQWVILSLIVSLILFVAKFAGLIKEHLLARYFGLSHANDAFKIVYNSIIFNLYAKFEKLLRPTYLPEFVYQKEQDEAQAWRTASVLTTLQLVALTLTALVLIVFARPLLQAFWPTLASDPEALRLAVILLWMLAPLLVVFSLSVMPELTLHAYKRFSLPAMAEACYRILLVIVLALGVEFVWHPGHPDAILAMGVGTIIGGTSRLLVMLPGLGRKLRMFRLSLDLRQSPGVIAILALMPPVVVGLAFSFFRTLADSMVANRLGEGMYTALDFGRKISDAGIMILPLAVSFVVYPWVSEWALRQDRRRLTDSLVGMTRAMAFVFVPLSVAMILLAEHLVRLVYSYDEFRDADVHLVATALICYASGLFVYAVEGSINKWYFALKDTRTPNYIGALWAFVNIVLVVIGGLYTPLGLVAVALALPLTKGAKVLTLYLLLRPRLAPVRTYEVVAFAVKLLTASLAMGGVVWMAANALEPALLEWTPPIGGKAPRLLALLGGTGVVGAVVFLALAALLRVEEVGRVWKWLRRKAGRIRA